MIGLLNPRSARWKHRIPLSILSLAAVLEGRHPYQLIDGNIDRDVRGILSRAIQSGNVRYLGVTVMPGPQLAEAITLTQQVKRMRPELQPTISAKRPETRRCPAAFSAERAADSRPRPVDRALRNFDRRLTLVSEFRSVVPKRREQATSDQDRYLKKRDEELTIVIAEHRAVRMRDQRCTLGPRFERHQRQ